MDYQDSDPENQEFVEEIRKLKNFNNLHCHFPKSTYQWNYERAKEFGLVEVVERMEKNSLPLWKLIDEFVDSTGFDMDAYWADFNKEYGGAREKSQIRLYPMYIFLRKKGFSQQDLTG